MKHFVNLYMYVCVESTFLGLVKTCDYNLWSVMSYVIVN